MNSDDGHEELLGDLLADGAYESFRETLRLRCLREGAARRRSRAIRGLSVAAAVLVAAGTTWLALRTPAGGPLPMPVTRPTSVPAFVVHSRALQPLEIVLATAPVSIGIVRTKGSVEVVRRSAVEIIHDEDLLALFSGRPRALVEIAPGVKRFLFLDTSADGAPGSDSRDPTSSRREGRTLIEEEAVRRPGNQPGWLRS